MEAPRAVAATLLGRVLRSGAYSNVVLGRLPESPDGRLIRRLVYGTLRNLLRVDRLLAQASSRPLENIQIEVLDVLRIAAWELRFGAGAPHAAVNEAVDIVAARFGRSVGGFANAVLRAVQSADEDLPAGPEGSALECGVAPWMLDRLSQAWGSEEAESFLRASLLPAPPTRRLRPGASSTGAPVPGIAGAVVGGERSGSLVPMDPASVAVGLSVGAAPTMSVLDLAAAPGGKTLHLFDQLGATGLLVAADRHTRRTVSARDRLAKLGADVRWVVADGRQPPFAPGSFDRILVDAPCTGLGTLRRRPEIRHRLDPASPSRLAEVQRALIDSALQMVKPDGLVVYSACTVFTEETSALVESYTAAAPDGLPGRPEGKGWLLAPHLSGTDGMFISILRP